MAKESGTFLVDGSVMEGGGQILRNAAALSCILGKSITVNNIRMGRDKPGLRPQHLTSLQMISELCAGSLSGGAIGSTEICLHPGDISSGEYIADTRTAGSICLLLQAALPCLLFASGPTQLRLKGGTNAEMAPQIDYLTWVLQPMLKQFGVVFDCRIIRRGYFPKGGGEVVVGCQPVSRLRPIDLTSFGQVAKLSGRAFVAGTLPIKMAQAMADAAKRVLHKSYPQQSIHIDVVKEMPNSAVGNGSGIIVMAETSTGCRLAGSALGKRGVPAERVGQDAASSLITCLAQNVCVDDHLQDQMVMFMALAEGKSRLLCGDVTQHTHTAIHTAELLSGAAFRIESLPNGTNIIECDGIGLENGHVKS